MIKKCDFDICGGDCSVCVDFGLKNMSVATILTKKKVSRKFVPPDMSAIKLLQEIESNNKSIDKMTDEELENYKNSIILELKNE